MKTWLNNFAGRGLGVLSLACFINACNVKPHTPNQSPWQNLNAGDYMREEYVQSLTTTRSPLKSWRAMQAEKSESVEIITIGTDTDGTFLTVGYNFHEGSEPIRPAIDGSVALDNSRYSIQVLDNNLFVLSNDKNSLRFRYVGDWQKWSSQIVFAGTYHDEKGRRYTFEPNGNAEFPSNLVFDYNAGLDMILTSYDYVYSNKLKRTWAFRFRSDTLEIFDVDLDKNEPEGLVAPKPRWKLIKLASLQNPNYE